MTMNDEIREQISALADDELSDVERPLLLGRLQRDHELRAFLGRCQLIGEVMRGTGEAASLGIADRVQTALAADAPLSVPLNGTTGRVAWIKPAAGLAVAASVALVAVLSVNSLRKDTPEPAAAPALASAGPAASPEAAVARVSDSPGEQWDRLDPRIDKRLSGYLVNHNEYAASRGVQGVMPYVRIVGYDTSE
jgi:sigma-E factor negative regulatory protein RseA